MCSSKLLVRERKTGAGGGGKEREKILFGAEMGRIDSVAPSGERHF